MKALLLLAGSFALAFSAFSLPLYDNFSTYGAPGTWTEASGPPIVSYTTGAPLLGGNIAPSGESWILYTNAPTADLYSNYYSGDFTGYANQNVAIVNYFATGQPGASDTPAPHLPSGFPGPFVAGLDTSTNSVWTPGYSQTGEVSPAAANYLGGIGACLQFASPVPATAGSKIFVSFFVDMPDCTGAYGTGQSLDHGYTAGFINSAEVPTVAGVNQNVIPGYAGYGSPAPTLFAKFNMRDVNTSNWRTGVGYLDSNANSDNSATGEAGQKTIHFVVISYEFNGGYTSTGQDAIHIWTDPVATSFGALTEPTADATSSPTEGVGASLPDAGGFFFLANTQDGGATPNSGVIFNSLSIGTNWAYVTGGTQFTGYAPATTNITSGQTLVLNSTAAAGGGVSAAYSWQTNNGINSGPLIVGGRFSVGPAGALTISNVQPGDAGTYTLQVSTPITAENSVTPGSTATVVTVTPAPPTFTSENASALGSGQFQLNFTGPAGSAYRLWSSTNLTLGPVTNTWNLVTNGTFSSGANIVTDTAATSPMRFYVITVP